MKEEVGPSMEPEAGGKPQIDRKLLEFLVCPVTRGPLAYDPKRNELISRAANLAYPIQNGIPMMLVDEARTLDD